VKLSDVPAFENKNQIFSPDLVTFIAIGILFINSRPCFENDIAI